MIISMLKLTLWKSMMCFGSPAEGISILPRDMGFIELALKRRIGFCLGEKRSKGRFSWNTLHEKKHGDLTWEPMVCSRNKRMAKRDLVVEETDCKCVSKCAGH